MSLKDLFHKYRNWFENGFWIALFVIGYIVMQKVMHPGWTIFGL